MDALPDDVLQDVLALLDVRSLAAICVACRRAWLVTAERDSLYRPHCTLLYDYSILNRTRDQSFGQAFRRLRGEYGRYAPDKLDSPRPSIFARAKAVWRILEDSVAEPVRQSLRPGATEAELNGVENQLDLVLPEQLRALWRVHDGQQLQFDTELDADVERSGDGSTGFHKSIGDGLFGGYHVYDHWVNTRLMPLSRIERWSGDKLGGQLGHAQCVIASSFNLSKIVALDCSTSELSVIGRGCHTPAAPEGKGVLGWLEEFGRRLSTGVYACQTSTIGPHNLTELSLFPRLSPRRSSEVTRGVLVECAAIAQPELSVLDRNGAIQHLFTYSVEFSMLAESEQRDRHQPKVLSRAQLKSRHWRFRDAAGNYDDVEGEGVIGEYPILSPDDVEAFVYQSQARVMAPKDGSAPPPSMKGHFKFVEGTLNSPSGDIFDAVCGEVPLVLDEYLY